jgi:methyltransferase (TIGR00027 family)
VSEVSVPTPLPVKPNLEQQRKRARALLKAARADNREALRRFQAVLAKRATKAQKLSLSTAQFVIAREYGFESWPKLKGHIEARLMSPLGSLALINAASRALETERVDALYRDPFARQLAGDAGMALFHELRAVWGTASGPPPPGEPQPYLSIRTRFFDEKLQNAVREMGLNQVVVLGAGMDARVLRFEWPSDLAWFEIDSAEVLERKDRVLRRLSQGCSRRAVCADLAGDWLTPLLAAGFVPTSPAAFLIEGVLLYLDPRAAAHVLRTVSSAATYGSWIGLDLVCSKTVTSPLMAAHLQRLAELGRPAWQFTVDDPEALLVDHGWRGTSVMAGSPEANHGRWPMRRPPGETSAPGLLRAFFVEGSRESAP